MKTRFYIISTLLILMMLIFSLNNLSAQQRVKEEKRFSDKIFFGGSIGMVFGTVTRIDILPEVGLWVIPQWSIGVGGRYTYRKERARGISGEFIPYEAHIWGVSGFTQIMPIPDLDKTFKIGIKGSIFFHGEWEGLYLDKQIFNPLSETSNGKGWVHMFMAGVGYRVPLGDRSALNVLVLWDLTNSSYSIYTTNPLLRISINF